MTTDLVKRLRLYVAARESEAMGFAPCELVAEAADEIERLRALLKRVRGTMPPLCYAAPAEAQLIEDIERALGGGR